MKERELGCECQCKRSGENNKKQHYILIEMRVIFFLCLLFSCDVFDALMQLEDDVLRL